MGGRLVRGGCEFRCVGGACHCVVRRSLPSILAHASVDDLHERLIVGPRLIPEVWLMCGSCVALAERHDHLGVPNVASANHGLSKRNKYQPRQLECLDSKRYADDGEAFRFGCRGLRLHRWSSAGRQRIPMRRKGASVRVTAAEEEDWHNLNYPSRPFGIRYPLERIQDDDVAVWSDPYGGG
jgi:hypothetical protein